MSAIKHNGSLFKHPCRSSQCLWFAHKQLQRFVNLFTYLLTYLLKSKWIFCLDYCNTIKQCVGWLSRPPVHSHPAHTHWCLSLRSPCGCHVYSVSSMSPGTAWCRAEAHIKCHHWCHRQSLSPLPWVRGCCLQYITYIARCKELWVVKQNGLIRWKQTIALDSNSNNTAMRSIRCHNMMTVTTSQYLPLVLLVKQLCYTNIKTVPMSWIGFLEGDNVI